MHGWVGITSFEEEKMDDELLTVFTFKSIETILEVGGTQSWSLDPNRAGRCRYVVCVRNRNRYDAEGEEPHGQAFLIGRISKVVPSTQTTGRWLIRIDAYAQISVDDFWGGERNPVVYRSFKDLGLAEEALKFKAVPSPKGVETNTASVGYGGLTFDEARQGLAIRFGVPVDSVEITIRG